MIPYLTDEQRELRNGVRMFLDRKAPLTETRRIMASDEGYDRGLWRQMANDLGLHGLGVDEGHGGSGRTYVELCLVMEELGYALTCSPFLMTALAACALQEAGTVGVGRELLPAIVAGETVATVCLADAAGTWGGCRPGVAAYGSEEGGWTLTGGSRFVVDAHVADVLVVLAHVNGRAALFSVDAGATGLDLRRKPALDQTRALADVVLDSTPGRLVSVVGAEDVVARVLDMAAVLLAAEQLGGARRALDMSVAYAGARVQFGRPIGSFQAIKHRCADMQVRVESVRSLVFYASRLAASGEGRGELPTVASMAKAFCSDAFFEVAADAIQIHGGLGFTWEHDAHLFFKRATASRLMFGDPVFHRDRLVTLAGLDA
jgi:alkylation response protein AidB-like acyl-CoA dehydrogenase